MRTQISTEKGKITNVKIEDIIDVKALDTPTHEDDKQTWNAFEPYGESDMDESEYKPPSVVKLNKKNRKRMERIIGRKINWAMISQTV